MGASVRAGVRLGVDVGSVRVGVARSDPAGLLATPLVTLRRGRTDLADLAALVAEHAAVEVVVGLPRTLADREGKAAQAATSYARRLAERLGPRRRGAPGRRAAEHGFGPAGPPGEWNRHAQGS